eukprot:55233-Amphidinium_carterae.1
MKLRLRSELAWAPPAIGALEDWSRWERACCASPLCRGRHECWPWLRLLMHEPILEPPLVVPVVVAEATAPFA